MESGALPDKVSQRLIWSSVAATYTRLDKIAEIAEKLERRVIVLERVETVVGIALVGLALRVIFGA